MPARTLPGEWALPRDLFMDLEGSVGMGLVWWGPQTKKSSEANPMLLSLPNRK